MIRFLCSVRFALVLLASALGLVIAATWIEAVTGSHEAASKWVYRSPWFLAVLVGAFINILGSALKRWPFQKRHIPFLTAHLGLLMVISGQFVKLAFGVQGELLLAEGAGSHTLLLDHHYRLAIEDQQGRVDLISMKKGRGESTLFPIELVEKEAPPLEVDEAKWISLAQRVERELPISMGGSWLTYLKGWGGVQGGLFPIERPLSDDLVAALNQSRWELLPEPLQATALWSARMIADREEAQTGPLLCISIASQVEQMGERLPLDLDLSSATAETKALLLSALLYARGFHPQSWAEEPGVNPSEGLRFFECNGERVALSHHGKATLLGGAYSMRLQWNEQEIPHHLRLHDLRTVCYPGSSSPYGYEGRFSIDGERIELAMNRVYESQKGYRFYLAQVTPVEEQRAQRAVLIVNRDPAKRGLTYPGAGLVALGSFLFYRQRFKRR